MEEKVELREREVRWRQLLVGTSLVMESDVDQGEATDSFRWLGNIYRICDTREEQNELLFRFRANFLIGLTAVGGRDYDEGTFWPFVSAAFGVDLSQGDVDVVSTRYKEILDHYGLRRFTMPLANIGEILMHAGVPVGSIEGFLRLLVKQDRRGAGTSGSLFTAWARLQNRESASMSGLDAPTWRFLREGGEIAEDFVDRCLVAFDASTSGGVASDSGLARHIVEEMERLVESRILERRPGRGARSREVTYVPVLTWDGAAHGVAIVLPALEVLLDDTVLWTLTSEGLPASYSAKPPWPEAPATTIRHSLPRPTKAVSVIARPGEQEWVVRVVDPDDPLLVFDASNGELIPVRNSLPRDRVIIGAPRIDDEKFDDLVEFDGPHRIVSHHQSPIGWESWEFATVDLGSVTKLRRGEDDWRIVSTSVRPQMVYPDALLGTRTADDSLVYADAPRITLPAVREASAHSPPWVVSLVEESSGKTLWATEVRAASDSQEVAVWPDRPSALLGRFVVNVRGALGRGLTRRIAIAEGWSVTHEPRFRYLTTDGGGIEAAAITFHHDNENVPTLSLDQRSPSINTTLSLGTNSLQVIARVPHMDITVTHGVSLPVITLRPQFIDIEALEDSQLRVTVPANSRAILGLVSGAVIKQTIDAGISGQSEYVNFNISQFADTARSARSALLQLRIGEKSVPVGTLRPRKIAEEVAFDPDSRALLISPSAPQGLTAAIYPKYAPWAKPTVVRFDAGTSSVELKGALSGAGEATVMLRIDDPWSPSPWPDTPDRFGPNVFPLTLLPLPAGDDTVEGGFSRWLAGESEMPRTSDALPVAAKILALLGTFATTHEYSSLRSQISDLFGTYPARFIDTVMQVPLKPSTLMRLLVDSNLAATAGGSAPPVPGSWPLSSFLGLIGDYMGTRRDSDPQFISNLENFAGTEGLVLLTEGNDPHAKLGRFDYNTVIIDKWPREDLDEMWAAVSPIPGRLLQPDARWIAARELFDARKSRSILGLTSSSQLLLRQTRNAIFEVLGSGSEDPIEARIGADGWRNLPAISMALAIVARLAARDLDNMRGLYAAWRNKYAQLAEAAPAFVEQDLVIAELWIMNWRNEWTP